MNELVKVENGTAVLAPETAAKLAEFERKAKEIKDAEDELRAKILEEMQENEIKKIETEEIVITFIEASDRETFQTKEFRAAHADLYDAFVKITPVKASVRIKIKEAK